MCDSCGMRAQWLPLQLPGPHHAQMRHRCLVPRRTAGGYPWLTFLRPRPIPSGLCRGLGCVCVSQLFDMHVAAAYRVLRVALPLALRSMTYQFPLICSRSLHSHYRLLNNVVGCDRSACRSACQQFVYVKCGPVSSVRSVSMRIRDLGCLAGAARPQSKQGDRPVLSLAL